MSSTGKPSDRRIPTNSKGPDNYENGYARGFDEGYKAGYRDGFSNGARNNNPIAHVEEDRNVNNIQRELASAIADHASDGKCQICTDLISNNILQPKSSVDDDAEEGEWVLILGSALSSTVMKHLNDLSMVTRADIIKPDEH